MARIYIESDMARFTRKDITHVDVELYGGQTFTDLEPRRLFPLSGKDKYVTLLDNQGIEQAVIRDLAKTGKTMMIVTHEMNFARAISNRVFYMDAGGIYEDGFVPIGGEGSAGSEPSGDRAGGFSQQTHRCHRRRAFPQSRG